MGALQSKKHFNGKKVLNWKTRKMQKWIIRHLNDRDALPQDWKYGKLTINKD